MMNKGMFPQMEKESRATIPVVYLSERCNLVAMDDHQLVRDCLKGSRPAQKLLYEQYAGILLGVCYRYTKSMEDAEDILQEGFIKVFKNLHQYRFDGPLGAWLRRIMINTAVNYLKKNRHYQQELSFSDATLHPVSNDDPELLLNVKDLTELIRQLPSGYQAIFNLHGIEGYSHAEIGKIFGINEATSRSQYSRARTLLISWVKRFSNDAKTEFYARP
jgi:RNA polymerase sigma factor (sigma-70 family)